MWIWKGKGMKMGMRMEARFSEKGEENDLLCANDLDYEVNQKRAK